MKRKTGEDTDTDMDKDTITSVEVSPVYKDLPLPEPEKRTVFFRSTTDTLGVLVLVDQPKLPAEFRHHTCNNVQETSDAIRTMVVRGAPAIGVAGAYGMVLAAMDSNAQTHSDLVKALQVAKAVLDKSRPTAVNLMWATARMISFVKLKPEEDVAKSIKLLVEEAGRIADGDRVTNWRMARHGAAVVPQFSGRPTNILHHCNTGALACVDWGTALGVIHYCHKKGRNIHVWVDETRPRLQGARLSAWELMQAKCPLHLIADSVAGSLMRQGKVDVVLFGADRVAANGDTVNKIGSYNLAVLAKENGVPVYPVVPTSTIDLSLETGDEIPIEERGAAEVTNLKLFNGPAAPKDVPVYNAAFDNTPHRYITGIITEEGICYPPFKETLRVVKAKAEQRIKESWG